MDVLLQVIWDKLQFGFDILLPLVGVWALFKWLKETKRKTIADMTKSALIENLNKLIERSSEYFIKEVVVACQSYEKRVDRHLDGLSPQDANLNVKLTVFHENYNEFNMITSEFAAMAREKIDEFYDITQVSRYSLYPLLRVVGAGEYIDFYEKETDQILEIHNEITESIGIIGVLSSKINASPGDNKVREDFAKFVFNLSVELQKARIECKEVCAFLSALLNHVASDGAPENFSSTLEEYKGSVLKCNTTIR